MRALISSLLCITGAVLLGGQATRAQNQSPSPSAPPIPAYRSPWASIGTDSAADANDAEQSATQNQPLSGVQPLSLGMEATRSYWQPHLDVSGTADSNPTEMGEGQSWVTWINASAGADIHRVAGRSDLSVGYTAGGVYSDGYASGNGVTQGLNLSDKLSFRRSTLSFFDQASYLPESAFGLGGASAGGLSALSTPGLAFNPGQTVLTGQGQMLSNADAAQWDELLTPRSSLTFAGGYSLLHYFGSGSDLFNYGMVNARGGYNYKISANNSLAVLYTFSDYRYANSGQSMMDHALQVSFGRVLTQKLAFQAAGGPLEVFSTFSPTVAGSTGGSAAGTGLVSESRLLWSVNTSLEYQERRYELGLAYTHGVNGGSGVLLGSEIDTVTGSLVRQMSRTFSSGFSAGYSKNRGLPGEGVFATQSYGYWFGGLNLTKPIGPTLGFTLSYQVQYQTSNAAACIGPICGENVLRHLVSVGLGWHERPLLF